MAVAAHDQILLCEGDRVVGDPVDHQTAGEPAQHKHEHERHPSEQLLLHRIGGSRVQFLLQPHRNAQQNRQHTDEDSGEQGVRRGRGQGKAPNRL